MILPAGNLLGESFEHNAMIIEQNAYGDTHKAAIRAMKKKRDEI
jgi:hypothetical protein